ncbi:hypothetical protein LIER_25621 [Lithospermum erythrorhizon]|uniref:Uncharacterized protein n=1 Tax=Lithospermum erythrorhizon TaxID=34254 RepID=A0AAV3R950_LITER
MPITGTRPSPPKSKLYSNRGFAKSEQRGSTSEEYTRSRQETCHSHESNKHEESPAAPKDEVNSTSTVLERRKNKSIAPSQVPATQVDQL